MPVQIIHPMVVHFPIVFVTVAFLAEGMGLIFNAPSLRRFAFWNLVLGAWSALIAGITGGVAAASLHGLPLEQRRAVELHGTWAAVSFGLIVLVCSWYLSLGKKMKPRTEWIAWILLGFTCGLLAIASHLGARLVYEQNLVQVNLP